jgi:tetratricopeptide (TPR) repeat protein
MVRGTADHFRDVVTEHLQPGTASSIPIPKPIGLRRWVTMAVALAGVTGLILFQNAEGSIRALDELQLRAPGADKVFHCVEYLAVFLLFETVLNRSAGVPRVWRLLVAGGVAAILSFGDELVQGSVAGRNVELADALANICGVGLGVVLVNRRHHPRLAVGLVIAAVATVGSLAYVTYAQLKDYNRGLLYSRARQYALAREHYQRALAAGLRTSALFNSLGWLEIEAANGDPQKAVAYAERALALQPADADILDTYGWALLHAGRSREALDAMLEAYARKPRMYCIHYHLGMAYRAVGRPAEAIRHFAWQIELMPETVEARLARLALDELDGWVRQ